MNELKVRLKQNKEDIAALELEQKRLIKEIKRQDYLYQDIKDYCNSHEVYCSHKAFVKIGQPSVVKVPLPTDNINWTYSAWDWTKAFCKHFEEKYFPYPLHKEGQQSNYVYIHIGY